MELIFIRHGKPKVEPGDNDCVVCAKSNCCKVFLACYASKCSLPDPGEETCLDDHCTAECP